MKILIADDNKQNRYLLESMLKGNDYEVISATNGQEALENLDNEKIDLIISDILMPVMDGFQFCSEVKQTDGLENIPFIFYTATYTDKRDEQLALDLGADKFIIKPTDPVLFMKIIQDVIKETEKGKFKPKKPIVYREKEKSKAILKLYNERLVDKLERKMLDLETAKTEREKVEERILHLNTVLHSIRNVNQLITKEKDRTRLVQGICEVLVKNRGYSTAWIVLLDESRKVLTSAEAGLGKQFGSLIKDLNNNKIPSCVQQVLNQTKTAVFTDLISDCKSCPLVNNLESAGAMSIQLLYDGKIYGIMTISTQIPYVKDEEEQDLFKEVAEDISYALNNLELEEERKKIEEALWKIEWQLTKSLKAKEEKEEFSIPSYGKLSDLNNCRIILDSIREEILIDIVGDFLDLLETSTAIYEKNGDYALGIFASGWCKLLDTTSRNLCNTEDNKLALESGKWLCHESCWTHASKSSIETGQSTDIECHGGIRIYAAPIQIKGESIGSINFGYGNPPKDPKKIHEIAEKYGLSIPELSELAESYDTRPSFLIDIAKRKVEASAKLIGLLVEQRWMENALRESEREKSAILNSISDYVIYFENPDKRIVWANKLAVDATGLSKDQVVGKYCYKIWMDNDEPCKPCPVSEAFKTGKVTEVEISLSDGSIVLMKGYPVKNEEDRIVGVVKIMRDITERKKAESALKVNEDRLQSLLNLSQMRETSEEILSNFALEECVRLTQSKVGYLHFFNEDRRTIQLFIWSKSVRDQCSAEKTPHYPIEDAGIWADSVRMRKPVIHNDYQNNPDRKGYPEGHFPVIRHMSVPVFDEDRIVAVGGVGNKDTPYNKADLRQIDLYLNSMWRIMKQKRAEKALQESEKRLSAILEVLNTGVVLIDLETHVIIEANPAALNMIEATKDQVIGKVCQRFMCPTEENCCPITDLHQPVDSSERVLLTIKGERKPILKTATPVIFQGHEYILESFIDITELKQAEQGLKESEHTIRERVKELNFLFQSSQLTEDQKLSTGEILQRIVESIPSAFQFPAIIQARIYYKNQKFQTRNFTETAWSISTETKILRDSLRIQICYSEDKLFLKEERNLIKEIGTRIKNSFERREAQIILLESENKYKTLVENIPQKIFLKDRNSVYISCNYNYAQDLKIAPAEIVGKTDHDFYPIELAEKYRLDDLRIIKSGEAEEFEEIYIQDGEEVWVYTVKTPIRDIGGKVSGIIGIFWDITEKKQTELARIELLAEVQRQHEELKEIDRLKDEFFEDVAHELHTPLVSIKGFAEILKENTDMNESSREDLEIILRNEERIERLIREMLDYSRLKSGKIQFKKDHFQLSVFLEDIIEELKHLIKRKQLNIEMSLDHDVELAIDKDQIAKVVTNLLVNAIKFSLKGGKILISSSINNELWTLSVRDYGIGISKKNIPKIFTRFARLKTADGMRAEGIGLGLAISKKVIDNYGGKVWIESDGLNKGATAIFQLNIGNILEKIPL